MRRSTFKVIGMHYYLDFVLSHACPCDAEVHQKYLSRDE